jgi:hypothetical protein
MRDLFNKKKLWIVYGLIGLAFFFSAILNWAWLEEEFIKPLYLLWLYLQFYLSSVPGLLFWVIFLTLAVIAFGVTLIDLFKQKIVFEFFHKKEEHQPLQQWAERIELASQGNLFRWSLNREISEIAIELIMLRENMDKIEARRHFNSGAWTNDESLRKLLSLELPTVATGWRDWIEHKKHKMGLFARSGSPRGRPSAELKKIIDYLEDYADQGGRGATR